MIFSEFGGSMIYNDYHTKINPNQMIRVITNTDAKNEADDQYAIVQALLSPSFDNIGIIASHFGKHKMENSMDASYNEVVKILRLMDFDEKLALRGSEEAMDNERVPKDSEGARLLISEAMRDDERPLFAIFLGPLTDMASALLLEPRIVNRMTCIWIGGNRYPEGGWDYNLANDVVAANVVFKSKLPVWQIPRNIYKKAVVSLIELEMKVRNCGELGRYLFDQLIEVLQNDESGTRENTEYWCMGDSPAVGLLLYGHIFEYDWIPAPEFGSRMEYVHTGLNRPIRVYNNINERFVLEDFFCKLKLFTDKQQLTEK